jgi:hypothetical protein
MWFTNLIEARFDRPLDPLILWLSVGSAAARTTEKHRL